MSAYNLPDYCTKYFEYKTLHKIHGQPTLESLVIIFRQLKRNAQSVPTTLGGGQLGYLALILPTTTYNSIPNSAPFVRPTDPGIFTLSAPAGVATHAGAGAILTLTAADIATQKIKHDEKKRQYNEMQAIESALRTQLTTAIDGDYLRPLRNIHMDMINDSLQETFTFLRTTYGKITTSQLKAKEMEVDQMVYDPYTSVESIFNKIQDFQDICGLIGKHKTDSQLVDTAYLIFQKSGLFRDLLIRWNKQPDPAKTFQDFKIFMRAEYLDLQEVGGMTLANSTLNTMNIVQELKHYQEDVVSNLKNELAENFMQTLQAMHMTDDQENQNPNLQSQMVPTSYIAQPTGIQDNNMFSAVQTAQDPILQQLLAQMAQMQSQIENLNLTNKGSSRTSYANKNKNRHRQRIKLIRRQENSGEGIVGHVDVVTIGEEIVRRKRVATRTTLLSVTAWMVAIKIASDFYKEQQVNEVGIKITPI